MEANLAATVSAAQLDALRFAGRLPARAWRASPSRRWLRWGVPLCLLGAALLALCEVLAAQRPVPERFTAPLPLAELPVTASPSVADAQPDAQATAMARAAVPADTPAQNGIDRQRAQLVMAIDALPLADAARRLAALTATSLHGVEALPVTLVVRRHWVGVDPAAAWRALLGDDASYAVHCGPQRCEVHIAGAAPPALTTAAPGPLPSE